MTEENTKVFEILDNFCSARGLTLSNRGRPRWIKSTQGKDKRFLKYSRLRKVYSLSKTRKAAHFTLYGRHLFVTTGFDFVDDVTELVTERVINGGTLTAVVSSLLLQPNSTPYTVRNFTEPDYHGVPGYTGHSPASLQEIWPEIRMFEIPELPEDEIDRLFFNICAHESRRTESWIGERLGDTLIQVGNLNPSRLPFHLLWRGLLDDDPGTLFFSMYRTLEGIYAFSAASKLRARLGVVANWKDTAIALEDELGWWPKEDEALKSLFAAGTEYDSRIVLDGFAFNHHQVKPQRLPELAARRVYKLRNGMAHFRREQNDKELPVNWELVCEGLAGLMLHSYADADS